MSAFESVAPGTLLIAHPSLKEPIFHQSVILVLEHGPQGTQGLILNKPTEHTIAQSINSVDPGWSPEGNLFVGGPVFRQWVFVLHSPEWRTEDTVTVTDDLCLTMGSSAVPLLRDSYEPYHYRFCLGASAWAPNQLEMEFERGRHIPAFGWLTAEYPGAEWIFDQDPGTIYTSALSLSTQQAISHWL